MAKTQVDGILSQTAKAALEEAVRAGIAPIPLKLRLMRHYWLLATGGKTEVDAPIVDVIQAELAAIQAADIAPYIHPKMAAIQHSGDEENPVALLMRQQDGKL